MGEIANLNQIVAEIKFFENQAVVSYWEIGKRLSQAKEQVGHGEWIPWIEENLNYTRQTASSLIRVYESYPNGNTSLHLNFSKVLALTSIKDEEDRQNFIDSHEVEDMTTRQLQAEIKEYKAGLEEKEKQLEESTAANKRLADKVIELEQREPEIIEKEVVPEDYEDLKAQQKDLLDIQRNLEEELYQERKKVKEVVPDDYELTKAQLENANKKLERLISINQSLKEKEKLALSKLESEQAMKKIVEDASVFHYKVLGFIQEVGGLIYLTEYLDDIPKDNKKLFLDSARFLRGYSEQLYKNVEQHLKEN